ncbi:hypothetical protein OJF2_01450 [Aquisphaera giovannonii]|uniref:DUF1559 domain-containing protein n=1 Tax=Aquisphaera giovannonii TaxID=406548 RepID=A0A5B9VVE8_9BACT|nr:DUF1559 domain-containing protein [Aquisphaera giovannonii]QEH31680.1 hypothetical protein OJF2_01450 [Aquisphaera giovannonii]
MSEHFEYAPEFGWIRRRTPKRGLNLVEVLVVVGLLGIVAGLLMPAVCTNCVTTRRGQCANNLRNIAVALVQYEQRYGAFPPAYTTDRDGRPLHSWRTLILPYLDQPDLYESIDLSKPWDDPVNTKAFATWVSPYHCPSSGAPENTTTYLANAAEGGLLMPDKPRRLAEVTDRLASTLMMIEVDEGHAVPWMAPTDADEALILGLTPGSKLPHPKGMNAAFVDGSVRYLEATTPPEGRRAMISIAGHDGPTEDPF